MLMGGLNEDNLPKKPKFTAGYMPPTINKMDNINDPLSVPSNNDNNQTSPSQTGYGRPYTVDPVTTEGIHPEDPLIEDYSTDFRRLIRDS